MGAFPLKINCDRQYSVKKKERKKLVTKEEEEGRSRQVKRFKIPHHFIESGFVGFILFIDIECLCYCFNLPVSDEEQNEQIEPFNFSKTVFFSSFFFFFFSSNFFRRVRFVGLGVRRNSIRLCILVCRYVIMYLILLLRQLQ